MARRKVLEAGIERVVHPINEVRATVLNQPSQQQLDLPFYNLLPKDPVELLRWKIYVRERCLRDAEFRADIEEMASQDICFFAATFVWVFEPRPPRGIPLAPWCDQADALAWMAECVATNRDLGVEKSRGIGYSWNVAILCYWSWKYVSDCKIALTTKDETTLDGPDANSLMGKIGYIHQKMPAWSRLNVLGKDIVKRTMDQHLFVNTQNGATIQGFPPTDEKLRSLRFTFVIYDEFGFFPRSAQASLNASVHTAPCRIFISTWNGHGNVFHEIMRIEKSTLLRVQSYWWANAVRWKGAYRTDAAGRLEIVDKSYKYPPDYPFVLDGLLRSPWVDYELRRAGSKVQSALEELYGLAAEVGRKLLRMDTVALAETTIRPPLYQGELDLTREEPTFRRTADGLVKLWADLGGGKGGPYVGGCDLAHGLGATPSVLEIIDLSSGKQVLEYADNEIKPVDFAGAVVELLRWINGHKGDGHCYLDFEANGEQAVTFVNELLRIGYGNIRRRRYARNYGNDNETGYYGTRNRDHGLANISEMERAVRDGELIVCSEDVVNEMRAADKDDKGKPTFHGLGDSHGDKLQALAIAWVFARDKRVAPADTTDPSKADPRAELKNYRSKQTDWRSAWTIPR